MTARHAGTPVTAYINGEPVPVTYGTPMVSPELAAAMAESRALRELVREICDTLVSQKYPARKVKPWLKRAGLKP